jgi:hypothetical protein
MVSKNMTSFAVHHDLDQPTQSAVPVIQINALERLAQE